MIDVSYRMQFVSDGFREKINKSWLTIKLLIDLAPSSPSREFNLHIGSVLNCLAFVSKCNECNLI